MRSTKEYQQIVLEKLRKNLTSSWLSFLKLKRLLAPEISKFTKIRKFQKNLFVNLRLLNDHGLIISLRRTRKLMCAYALSSKLGTLQARESTLPFQYQSIVI